MDLRELTAYAKAKYGIEEQYKWADFPGFSVLCHPDTGKWVALLMRQWDMDTGTEIQRCDLKCGALSLLRFQRPYLSAPVRMRGVQWLNIRFDQRTEPVQRHLEFARIGRADGVAREDHEVGPQGIQDRADGGGDAFHAVVAVPAERRVHEPEETFVEQGARREDRVFVDVGEEDELRAHTAVRDSPSAPSRSGRKQAPASPRGGIRSR